MNCSKLSIQGDANNTMRFRSCNLSVGLGIKLLCRGRSCESNYGAILVEHVAHKQRVAIAPIIPAHTQPTAEQGCRRVRIDWVVGRVEVDARGIDRID